MLSDRQARHAVPVRLTGPRRLATGEFDVDRALVERDLPLDISLTAFDEVVLIGSRVARFVGLGVIRGVYERAGPWGCPLLNTSTGDRFRRPQPRGTVREKRWLIETFRLQTWCCGRRTSWSRDKLGESLPPS